MSWVIWYVRNVHVELTVACHCTVTEYSPVHKNKGFLRQKSVEMSNKAPSLPKTGAQKMARQIANAHNNADFMKPPDPGMSG